MAFTRFMSRRGQPKKVYSDNGTHFRCGDKLLQKEFERFNSSEVNDFCIPKSIEWIFIPPSSPWWGGWWERLVGLVKRLLRRILGQAFLSLTELHTVLCSCEAILNRRPLTYLYDDPGSCMPLTPNHFLLPQNGGEPDLAVLEIPFSGSELRKRSRLKESLLSSFFARWSREYLGELRAFHRDVHTTPPQERQFVLIECEGKRQNWPLGVIETILPGRDQLVRVAKVRTNSGYVLRPVHKLYLLEVPEVLKVDTKMKEEGKAGDHTESEFLPVPLTEDHAESDPSPLSLSEDHAESDSSPLFLPENHAESDSSFLPKSNEVFTRVGRKVRIPTRLDL